ncbi:hypothetical protein J2S94_003301 [Arthrobacter bambusae]|nr:hypothetical protein [Arthrobacter bambusae]
MSEPTLHSRKHPVYICRENGWDVGTRLVGDEGSGPTVIEITGFGERTMLAKAISHQGKPVAWGESSWTLRCRDWTVAE